MRGWLVLLVVGACHKGEQEPPKPPPPPPAPPPTPPPVPAKALRQAQVEETMLVILPKGADVEAVAKRVKAKLAPNGSAKAMPPEQDPAVARGLIAAGNKDLTPRDLDAITSNAGIALSVTGEPLTATRTISAAALELARDQHGWVEDPMAGAAYTVAQFKERIPGDPIDVRKIIYVHAVQGDGDQPFLDTMGMTKLGLPELRVSAAASSQIGSMTIAIDATAQYLASHDVVVPGPVDVDLATLPGDWHVDDYKKLRGTAKLHWRVSWTKDLDSGDDELELVPAKGSGVEGAVALLDECFGVQPDELFDIPADDPELKAAAIKARAELVARRAHYAHGIPPGEQLSVKAPFHDGTLTEWMWVDVVAWNGDRFQGSLDNMPEDVKNVKVGQTVRVNLADVADFIAVASDGSRTGGYSVELMKKRGVMR